MCQSGVVNAIGVDVREFLSSFADAVLVGIDKRLEARAVAVEDFGHRIVVAIVAVGDMEPDILDRHVSADDEFVARAADLVAIVGREEHLPGRCGGIVVKDLRESLVKRRGGVRIPVEVGAGAENMEALAQTSLRGERPAGISGIERRHTGVVVVREENFGRRIEIGHAEGGHHVFLAGHLGRAARPLRGGAGFVETDFVGEDGSGRRFRDVGRGPPVVGCLVVAVIQLSHAGRAATDAARTLGETAVERVVNESLEAGTDGIALGPNDDVSTRLVELLGRGCDAADVVFGVMIDPESSVSPVVALWDVCVGWPVVDDATTADGAHVGLCAG